MLYSLFWICSIGKFSIYPSSILASSTSSGLFYLLEILVIVEFGWNYLLDVIALLKTCLFVSWLLPFRNILFSKFALTSTEELAYGLPLNLIFELFVVGSFSSFYFYFLIGLIGSWDKSFFLKVFRYLQWNLPITF